MIQKHFSKMGLLAMLGLAGPLWAADTVEWIRYFPCASSSEQIVRGAARGLRQKLDYLHIHPSKLAIMSTSVRDVPYDFMPDSCRSTLVRASATLNKGAGMIRARSHVARLSVKDSAHVAKKLGILAMNELCQGKQKQLSPWRKMSKPGQAPQVEAHYSCY